MEKINAITKRLEDIQKKVSGDCYSHHSCLIDIQFLLEQLKEAREQVRQLTKERDDAVNYALELERKKIRQDKNNPEVFEKARHEREDSSGNQQPICHPPYLHLANCKCTSPEGAK